jgi:hypothetical protein
VGVVVMQLVDVVDIEQDCGGSGWWTANEHDIVFGSGRRCWCTMAV